jgi:hypothetical protein
MSNNVLTEEDCRERDMWRILGLGEGNRCTVEIPLNELIKHF